MANPPPGYMPLPPLMHPPQPPQPGQPGQQAPQTPGVQPQTTPQVPAQQPIPGPAGGYYPGYPYPVPYLYPPAGMFPYPPLYNPYAPPPLPANTPLNPPPHLRGFQGPGGQIHPWPVAPGQADQAQAGTSTGTGPQATTQRPAQTTAPSQPDSSAPASQRPRTESQETSTSEGSVDSTSSASTSSGSETANNSEAAPSPRNAAAEAALRRLGGVALQGNRPAPTRTQSDTNTSTNPPSAAPPQPSEQQPTPTSQSNVPTPTVTSPTPAGPSQSQSQPSNATSPPPAPQNRYNLPNLIPAPDLSARPIAPLGYGYPLSQAVPPPFRFPAPPSSATVRAQMNFPAGATGPLAQSAQHQQQLRLRQQHYQHPTMTNLPPPPPYQQPTPLAELPQTLTDEQLGRLDRLTREAIDERLRILEGVSGTVWRCVEELTRLRSVLPRATPTNPASTSSQPSADRGPSADNVASSSAVIPEPTTENTTEPSITQTPSADTATGVQTVELDGSDIATSVDAPIPSQVSSTTSIPHGEAGSSGALVQDVSAENGTAEGSN